MPYEVLEKQIKALPEIAVLEVAHYVSYLSSLYSNDVLENKKSVTEKIDEFMASEPNAFDEFVPLKNASLSTIRELTKNDTW